MIIVPIIQPPKTHTDEERSFLDKDGREISVFVKAKIGLGTAPVFKALPKAWQRDHEAEEDIGPFAAWGIYLFALVIGALSLRTRGVYFIMITLAFAQMAYYLVSGLARYGGDDGLTLAARSTFFGSTFLKNDVAMYYVAFGVLLGAYLLLRAVVASRFGRVLRGIRENPVRMEAIGFAPYRYQLTAYVIAGLIAGVSGFLLANQTEFVSPAYTAWQRSGDLIFVLVLGGLGSLHGALLGAAVFSLLADILSHYTENWALIFGPILILVVLYARGGITGLFGSKS